MLAFLLIRLVARLPQFALEGHPIGQTGQSVVSRHMLQLGLQLHPFRDVDRRSDHPHASSRVIEECSALRGDPADEAIFLADRILVLKAHPGEVQEVIEVPVPRPRSLAQFNSPEFRATKARLEQLIHPPEVEESAEEAAVVQNHMIRFTDVADNVE